MYTDSHCHITCDELYPDLDKVLERMSEVSRVMIVCTNETEYLRALAIRRRDPERFWIAFGFYPGDADEVTKERLAFLDNALASGHVDVLGKSDWTITGRHRHDRCRKTCFPLSWRWRPGTVCPWRSICGTPVRIP